MIDSKDNTGLKMCFQTVERLNRQGISQTRDSYRNVMDGIGANLIQGVRESIAAGKEMRVVFDNIDFKILVNVILKNHRNSDMHWIAHFITFDRVPSTNLDDTKPLVADPDNFENINYLLGKEEVEKLRQDYIILVARVLAEFFPFMATFVPAIPKHIPHRY